MSGFVEVSTDMSGKPFTAATFLQQFRKSNSDWWHSSNGTELCTWVFRGQSDQSWRLVPSAFRTPKFNKLSPLIEKIRKNQEFGHEWFVRQNDKFKQAAYHYYACYEAVREFYQLALEIGLTDKVINLSDPFGLIGSTGRDRDYELYKFCTHEIVGLAQHHGVPTPFLDWTRKPEIAVHFATELPKDKKLTDIAVFALNIGSNQSPIRPDAYPENILSGYILNNENKYKRLPFEIKFDAPAKNSYLAAQHGIFTLPKSLNYYFASGEMQPLCEYISIKEKENTILKKFVLNKDEVPNLRKLLDRDGITEAHLKPSFDGVASSIISRWNY